MLLLQVFLTISILMGEGMYMVGRVLLSSECTGVWSGEAAACATAKRLDMVDLRQLQAISAACV